MPNFKLAATSYHRVSTCTRLDSTRGNTTEDHIVSCLLIVCGKYGSRNQGIHKTIELVRVCPFLLNLRHQHLPFAIETHHLIPLFATQWPWHCEKEIIWACWCDPKRPLNPNGETAHFTFDVHGPMEPLAQVSRRFPTHIPGASVACLVIALWDDPPRAMMCRIHQLTTPSLLFRVFVGKDNGCVAQNGLVERVL